MPRHAPTDSAELADILATYETLPVSEARSGIGPLADDVAYRSVRAVLTKHGRPVAAMVPIADLVALHRSDAQALRAMAAAADAQDAHLAEPDDPDHFAELLHRPGPETERELNALGAALRRAVVRDAGDRARALAAAIDPFLHRLEETIVDISVEAASGGESEAVARDVLRAEIVKRMRALHGDEEEEAAAAAPAHDRQTMTG